MNKQSPTKIVLRFVERIKNNKCAGCFFKERGHIKACSKCCPEERRDKRRGIWILDEKESE
jgi:hypothetical protein